MTKRNETPNESLDRESRAITTYASIKLCDLDHKSMRHKYCHRADSTLAYSDDPQAPMSRLIASLLVEGQISGIEYFRDAEGKAILICGYRRIAAIWHLIERKLDPQQFYPEMDIPAVEVKSPDPRDYLVRSVADNEVRKDLTEDEKFATAQQMIMEGISAPRAAQALGMSPTTFARYRRRIAHPDLEDYVRRGIVTQTDLDELLEAGENHARMAEVAATLERAEAAARAYVDKKRLAAVESGEVFDEEKEGALKKYIRPQQIRKMVKSIKEGKSFAWTSPDAAEADLDWTCKVDEEVSVLEIDRLKKELHKLSAEDAGKIVFKLSRTTKMLETVWKRKRAEEALQAAAEEDEPMSYAEFLQSNGDAAGARKAREMARLMAGEDDPSHGKVTPRAEQDLTSEIAVPGLPDGAPDA